MLALLFVGAIILPVLYMAVQIVIYAYRKWVK